MSTIIKIIILTAGCLLLCFNSNIIPAEELQYTKDNFNIDKVDAATIHNYSRTGLSSYIACMAVARDNVAICNKLSGLEAQVCSRHFFNLHSFLKELLLTGEVTLNAINACSKVKAMGIDECRTFAKGFSKKDISICNSIKDRRNQRECAAIIKQDISFCDNNKVCIDEILYIKAIENNDIKICDTIKTEVIKAVCKADIATDETICKECGDFKSFINRYNEVNKKRGGE